MYSEILSYRRERERVRRGGIITKTAETLDN